MEVESPVPSSKICYCPVLPFERLSRCRTVDATYSWLQGLRKLAILGAFSPQFFIFDELKHRIASYCGGLPRFANRSGLLVLAVYLVPQEERVYA